MDTRIYRYKEILDTNYKRRQVIIGYKLQEKTSYYRIQITREYKLLNKEILKQA